MMAVWGHPFPSNFLPFPFNFHFHSTSISISDLCACVYATPRVLDVSRREGRLFTPLALCILKAQEVQKRACIDFRMLSNTVASPCQTLCAQLAHARVCTHKLMSSIDSSLASPSPSVSGSLVHWFSRANDKISPKRPEHIYLRSASYSSRPSPSGAPGELAFALYIARDRCTCACAETT